MRQYYDYPSAEIEDLLGVTLVKIEGCEVGSEKICFRSDEGSEWCLYHAQDCCESVDLNEIIGDLDDLIGSPLLRAELVTSDAGGEKDPNYPNDNYTMESATWSFYKLATIKGEVVLRWLGSSNGYYSESVSMVCTKLSDPDAMRLTLRGVSIDPRLVD